MSAPFSWASTAGSFRRMSLWPVSHEDSWKQPDPSSPFLWLIRQTIKVNEAGIRLEPYQTSGSIDSVRSSRIARLEAVLFVADGPIPVKKLTSLASLTDIREVEQIIRWLNDSYQLTNTPYHIAPLAGGYQLLTKPDYHPWLTRLNTSRKSPQLTPSTLETLAIIAYRQPVTRADVEQIRGVQCVDILKQLMEDGFVRLAGEDTSLGRPYLYETTKKFLEVFGLGTLEQLPDRDSLRPQHLNAKNSNTEKAA